MVRPFFAIACTLDATRRASASGKSRSESTRGAAMTATTARTSAAVSEIQRRGPARSSGITSSGPASASGNMVSPRYSATFTFASSTGSEKKTVSASEIAISASPAALVKCASAYASSGRSLAHMRRSGQTRDSARPARPSSTSCHHGYRGGRGWSTRTPAPRSVRQSLAQQLLRELRVRGAPGGLHHLADEEPHHTLVPAAELRRGVGVVGDDPVGDRAELAGVGDLPEAPPFDDRLDPFAGRERLLQRLLRAGAREGVLRQEAKQVHEVLRGHLRS